MVELMTLESIVYYLCWLLETSVRKIRRFLQTDVSSSQHRDDWLVYRLAPGHCLQRPQKIWLATPMPMLATEHIRSNVRE